MRLNNDRYNYTFPKLTLQIFLRKALKCKPSAEFGRNIGIFGLKTTFYAYVLGEHTSMKNEL